MNFEHEFFKLATVWLTCRFYLCGGTIVGPGYKYDMLGTQIGELDYQSEMYFLCQEKLCSCR